MPTLSQLQVEARPGVEALTGLVRMLTKGSELAQRLQVTTVNALTAKTFVEKTPPGVSIRSVNLPFGDNRNAVNVPVDDRLVIAGGTDKIDPVNDKHTNGGAMADALASRALTLGRFMDFQAFNGEGTGKKDEIVGLKQRCTGDQLIYAGANGGTLTLDLLNAAIDACQDQGGGRVVYASTPVLRQVKKLIVNAAGGASVADVSGPVARYEGVELVALDRDHDGNKHLDFNETRGNSNTTASLYVVATGSPEMTSGGVRLLMGSDLIEVLDEGYENGMKKMTTFSVFGLSVANPRAAVRLGGILAA
jgi:hypothetical protein